MKKNSLPYIAGSAVVAARLFSDEERVALALRQWERKKTLGALFHVVTSGIFLARDIGALG
jgi:hypothetical protein